MYPLDDDEQAELATKLRYGIGLEYLVGQRSATDIREHLPARAPDRIDVPAPTTPPPDHVIRARAAALGITAGRRGQWIRR